MRRTLLIQLMAIELMLNAVNVLLVAFNQVYPANHDGQVSAFFVIACTGSRSGGRVGHRHRLLPTEA
ncbi:MAG: hypothetical protein R3A47_04720 [Polyangiales bacterium]